MSKIGERGGGYPTDNTQQVGTAWTADGILDFLAQHRDKLRAMGVTKIGLFGSYVRGEQRPDSDIDLLFVLDNFTWRRWMAVWNFLEDNLHCKVDLVPEEDLRPELHRFVFPEVRYAAGFSTLSNSLLDRSSKDIDE